MSYGWRVDIPAGGLYRERMTVNIPDHATMVRRLVAAYRGASAADADAGRRWYADAEAAAIALAAGTDGRVDRETAAGVIAAFSPRMPWARNLRVAAACVDAHVAGRPMPRMAMGASHRAAERVLAHEPGALRAPKVRAFAANLTGDTRAVTVDVWAVRAATGDPMPDGRQITPAQYRRIAAAYTEAAERVGIEPRDLQAVVWVSIRGRAS